MNTIYKTLSDFGLSKNEILVYLEAIKHTEISPFKLARLTKVPRTTVYDVMMTLALKGLITVKTSQGLEKQQTWIVAKNPSVLREMIVKRRDDLNKLDVDVVDILADLKKDHLQEKPNANFSFYPGIAGVKRVFGLIQNIPSNVEIYLWDHFMPMDTMGKEYINQEVAQGLKAKDMSKQKRVKTIIPLNDWTRHVLSYQYGRDPLYTQYHEFRFIDKSKFNLYLDMYVFLDRVALVCAKDEEAWGIMIKSKLLSLSFKSIFEVLWENAIPVTEKFVKSLGENAFLKEEKRRRLGPERTK